MENMLEAWVIYVVENISLTWDMEVFDTKDPF